MVKKGIKGIKGDRFKEFLVEAEDILNSMGKDLLKLGRGVKAGIIDPGVLNSIFRSAHTMKGMSGLCDCKDMSVLSIENLQQESCLVALQGMGSKYLCESSKILIGIRVSRWILRLLSCYTKGRNFIFHLKNLNQVIKLEH